MGGLGPPPPRGLLGVVVLRRRTWEMAAGGWVGGQGGLVLSLPSVKSHVSYLEGTFRSRGERCLAPMRCSRHTIASNNGNVPSLWLGLRLEASGRPRALGLRVLLPK